MRAKIWQHRRVHPQLKAAALLFLHSPEASFPAWQNLLASSRIDEFVGGHTNLPELEQALPCVDQCRLELNDKACELNFCIKFDWKVACLQFRNIAYKGTACFTFSYQHQLAFATHYCLSVPLACVHSTLKLLDVHP